MQNTLSEIRIGLDAVPLSQLDGGIGYFIFHLLDALIPLHPKWTFFLYVFSIGDAAHFNKYPNVIIRLIPHLNVSHSIWSQTILPYNVYKDNIDVFLGTTQSIPLFCRKKLKSILILYDFTFRIFPKTISSLKCYYLKTLTRSMIGKANRIISISNATAGKLSKLYARTSDVLIHPPIKTSIHYYSKEQVEKFLYQCQTQCYSHHNSKPTFNLSTTHDSDSYDIEYKKYFLTIGTLEPRKNFISLIETYLRILKNKKDLYPLVIVGDGGWKNASILHTLRKARAEFPDKIKCLGRVSDTALSHLLSGARYYLCFSLYEGYGMPLAEARYCRTPIICFDQPEMREAAENDGIFLPLVGFEKLLTQALVATPVEPLACRYTSTEEKARTLSHAILDLLRD